MSSHGQCVAVQEVEIFAIIQSVQHTVILRLPNRTPAHIGYRAIRTLRQLARKPWNYSQAVDVFFFRGVSQQLHAEADTKNGLRQLSNNIEKLMLPKPLHCIFGGTDARENDSCGISNVIRICRQGSVMAQSL